MAKIIELATLPEHAGRRVDVFLGEQLPELTRNAAQKLCEQGHVLVGGKPCGKNLRLSGGETISVNFPQPRPLGLPAQNIALDVVYEDASLIVVNKPRGLVVHPAPGNADGTLVNALLHHCGQELSGIGGVERPGILHRLDKMTSGLLVAAKTEQAHLHLAAQIKARTVERIYEAVVHGCPKADEGRVEAPIGRHPTERKKMSVNAGYGRPAATQYRVFARYRSFAHLQLKLETGRTHQIRVHMASIGHPIAGDEVYGPKRGASVSGGQCLHARSLAFTHPVSGQQMQLTSRLPDYFASFLERIGQP